MAALRTKSTPELRGLYANSNTFTQPQGTVPQLSNLYLTRRGAFKTVPGCHWVSSFDGAAPHVLNQPPILNLSWYAPSSGSSPDIFMSQFPSITPHHFLLNLQLTNTPGVRLNDASGSTFVQLASQAGTISLVPNTAQFGDYLIVGLDNDVPPNIFPTVTQLTSNLGTTDDLISVASTIPFAKVGYILIDNEIIGYTDKTGGTFTGLTRGAFGTSTATHTAGAFIYLAGPASTGSLIVTATSAPVAAPDTTINVTSTVNFPAPGAVNTWIAVGSEVMFYSSMGGTTFGVPYRGSAAAHPSGALVFAVAPLGSSIVETAVTANVSGGASSVNVSGTADFPPAGYILIDSEAIQYTGKTSTSFTGLVRGQGGSAAAAHNAGALVVQLLTAATGTGLNWGPMVNSFDPSLVYGPWPGTHNASASTAVAAVNIGTIIFVKDGAGILWLFRAQNSGVTAFGATYYEPEFFPNGTIYSDGAMTSGSGILAGTIARFTADMVGQPILVEGAGSGGGDLLSTIASYTNSSHVVLADLAGTTVASATYTIGTGTYGDIAKDYNAANKSGTVVWMNIGQAALSPPGAKFVFQHLNSVFLWGVGANYGLDGVTGPDALWQSDFGAPLNFNPAFVTFVGKGDGTEAQGGCVYSLSEAGIAATPQLVLFKDASTYSFLQSFPNASLVEVSGGLGCVAPATIQFIGGYGVMRLSYAGVTLFDGQLEHVTEYTDAIRGYLFGGLEDVVPVDFSNIQKCVSTQSVNPPFYMFFAPLVGGSGNATRGFGYDFGLKQWFVMDFPELLIEVTAAAFLPQSVVALSRAYQSVIGGAFDGAVRRVFSDDVDFDGVAIDWSLTLPSFGMPGTPVYIRRINPYITAQPQSSPLTLGTVPRLTEVTFNGVRRTSEPIVRPLNVPKSILGSIDVGETVLQAFVSIAGLGSVLIEGCDAQTSEKPTGRVGK